MVEIIVPIINKTFTDWHWNKTKFNERYKKYYKNVVVDTTSCALIEANSSEKTYHYSVLVGKGIEIFETDDKSTSNMETITVSGTYFLITDYDSQSSVLFYKI